ncbi:MAG: hypothetical protein IPJ41_10065 [Phycisphaerales bacterium]|nr:hypothetical protein [Phycisphaerales bacterium]
MSPPINGTNQTVLDERGVIPIVVGAHLRAEVEDRPVAAALRSAVEARLPRDSGLWAVVVCDLWYLNQPNLRSRPSLSVGRPELNAFGAFLADKLPSVLAADDRLIVQLDPEFLDPVASCWGVDPAATAEAVHVFVERWLEAFVREAVRASSG